MMLSTALTQMMDSCECVILLNTPNSIKPEDTLNVVVSPWIYSELASTLLLRTRTPQEHRGVQAVLEQREYNQRPIVIEYNIDTKHLIPLDANKICQWQQKYTCQLAMNRMLKPNFNKDENAEHNSSLDVLYGC